MVYHSIPDACFNARARKGHTQVEAAAFVGRSLRTWKSWESGESMPSAKHLRPLAEYTGLRLTDLVRLVQHDAEASDASIGTPVVRGGRA